MPNAKLHANYKTVTFCRLEAGTARDAVSGIGRSPAQLRKSTIRASVGQLVWAFHDGQVPSSPSHARTTAAGAKDMRPLSASTSCMTSSRAFSSVSSFLGLNLVLLHKWAHSIESPFVQDLTATKHHLQCLDHRTLRWNQASFC